MPDIDFLIIGAQKAGTTSLFEYLRHHPQIHMPPEKEISFFNIERFYRRGSEWYLSSVLRGVSPGAICGEASVGYMRGTPFGDLTPDEFEELAPAEEPLEQVVPRRIKEMQPDVRLICVLRDPVARAHSQYKMEVLNKAESRTFDNAVKQLLEPTELKLTRVAPTRTNSYIIGGEYCRILSGFLTVFGRKQLMVIFSDDLTHRPREVLRSAFEFIGVASDYVPDNLETRYRTAATKQRVPGLDLGAWQVYLAHAKPLRAMWHALPPPIHDAIDQSYRAASFRVAMWNARRGMTDDQISGTTSTRLVTHYRPDSEALAELLEVDVPWLASWGSETVMSDVRS